MLKLRSLEPLNPLTNLFLTWFSRIFDLEPKTMNYSLSHFINEKRAKWLYILIHKITGKNLHIGLGFFLMYAGFILLLLPLFSFAEPLSLSTDPQFFGFEDDLNSVSLVYGSPMVVSSPFASGNKAIKCQNGDYVRWDLTVPSKTLNLSFKIYWTKLPTNTNESFSVGEIFGLNQETWQTIFTTTLYSDPYGYKGWSLWTDMPSGRGSFISSDIAQSLETKQWYTIRITADLNIGTFEIYMDGTKLASIVDVDVPADVYVDFFRLGSSTKSNTLFVTYYDDVTISLLGPLPPPKQWSLRITSSSGGSTNPIGIINVDDDQNLTVTASQEIDYTFSVWTLNGAYYSKNSTVIVPAQIAGTRHTLHATFTTTSPGTIPQNNWLPFQIIGLGIAFSGAYILWLQKKK